jgi:hypothetical protein
MTRYLALYAAGFLLGTAYAALAAPPQNADPALAPWFRDLRHPKTGASCCDLGDCRPSMSRFIVKDGARSLQATTPDGDWVDVHEEMVVRPREPNPTGSDILCWLPHRGVMCFVFGVQT